MKHRTLSVCAFLTVSGLCRESLAQSPVFFRISSDTNSAITATANWNLTWTNATGTGSTYTLEWSFTTAGLATGGVETVAYGSTTGLATSLPMPRPTTVRPAPSRLRLIPDGTFQMGNSYLGSGPANPVHIVRTHALYMDKCEVCFDVWNDIRNWALTNGYADLAAGTAVDTNHPVQTVTWNDCAKWCNARSEKENLTAAYCSDAQKTNVYRTGNLDLQDSWVRWDANGYRLPTEAEWEKAARGGLVGHYFPWPSFGGTATSHIDGTMANFNNSGDPWDTPEPPFDVETTPVGYYNGSQVINGIMQGADMTNGYGLYDMAGNVREWCWDRYDGNYYFAYATNAWPDDPTGPTNGATRVLRGSSYLANNPAGLQCAQRYDNDPTNSASDFGFRCVRGL